MTDELKPVRCGCGGEAKVCCHDDISFSPYSVYCEKCFIVTDDYDNKAEAIEAWNRAMGERVQECAKDARCSERTAKAIEHDGVVTMDGKKYHHMEYLCENCKKKVLGGDSYCSHCRAKLIWVEEDDIPMEYFESGGR